MEKIIIGRKDKADFKQLELEGIDVKIDSGAYTSSFHCHHIERFEKSGTAWVKCHFLDPEHPLYHEKEFIFKAFKIRRVKSSNGAVEERISIQTEIFLFGKHYPIELTLTERAEMKYPVLLGRKFISKKFLIDTSRKNLSFKGQIVKVKEVS
ncbi:ATP-dependent zinc protease family protein [Mariniphaga sediminis]|uniref:ATP-dependent zinc protease family protein n=1 Tax=Mariniphaga sediminis TaxID=1628158 RepID=UPI0035627226